MMVHVQNRRETLLQFPTVQSKWQQRINYDILFLPTTINSVVNLTTMSISHNMQRREIE